MKTTCKNCLLDSDIPGVEIQDNGICNYCNNFQPFKPIGEKPLIHIFEKAKKRHRKYDALVPLSGGKDSTYVLLLAVKKYGLNVLTYTFDNGFMSDLAKENIETSAKKCDVDHIWVRPSEGLIKELYRTALLESGEICGICGLGIEHSMLKLSEAWRIPMIILGHSPTESNSSTSEHIYDQKRVKYILNQNKDITRQMLNKFLLYPNLNFVKSFFHTKTGRFGKKVNILYYIDLPSDGEIGEIIKKEMDWKEPEDAEYTRHFDCLAEPFTNYIREERFGISRRIPQLSNMIRNSEISREEALEVVEADKNIDIENNMQLVMEHLNITKENIENVKKIPVGIYGDKISTANRVFTHVRKAMKG